MLVAHGTYQVETKRFVLWAESSETHGKRRRQSVAHSFAASPDQFAGWLERCAPTLTPEPTTLLLWLPSTEKQPQASPELRAAGVFAANDETIELRRWQIDAFAFSMAEAVDLLLAVAHRDDIGRDMRFWHTALVEALSVISGQQVIPALERDGFHYRAYWQFQAERAVELAAHMPSICRAAVDAPDRAISPYRLLEQFMRSVVDTTIRTSAPALKLPRKLSPGTAWLAALVGEDSRLKLPTADAELLFKNWQAWSKQNEATGNEAFRIAFRLNEPEVESDSEQWRLDYLLQAVDEPSLIVSARDVWRGQDSQYLRQRFDQPQERLLRGLAFAGRLFPPILDSLRSRTPQDATFDTDQAYTFLQEVAPLLQGSGFRVLLPRWWGSSKARLTARAKVSGSKPSGKSFLTLDSLLRYDLQMMLGGEMLDYAEFMRLAALKQPLVQVRGQWVLLDPAQIEAGLKLLRQGGGTLRFEDAMRLGLDDAAATEGLELEGVQMDGWLKRLIESLKQPDRIKELPPPDDLRAELRPYQQRGYSWMTFLSSYGLGVCLADDMGLGKTVTTIAYLLRQRSHTDKPVLVVCPTSVVGNWRRELQRFAPTFKLLTHQGAERMSGEQFQKTLVGVDVVLTSYALLARDKETLEAAEWSTAILDEAQNIKNSSTKQAQAARALHTDHRIALTGTPVENRLTELWSILHFLNPGYLGSEKEFRRQFANPIEKLNDAQAAKRLKQLTAPFILRRLKTDKRVISDLPDKLEMKVYTTLTAEQGTLYEAVVKDVMERIEGADAEGDVMSRRGLVLSLLMQLKQICNHPAQYLKDGSALDVRSGKLNRLIEMLEEVYAVGDRALIFTQFAEMGELLQTALRNTFFDEPLYLYGGTKVKDREEMIRRFQAERGPTLFILSIKAGGVGLNLTRANHVFHFDRWWNPAVENQATDRAFRIGQTRNVQVHKFICAGTLEERIDDMIEGKRALAERIVGADESWLTELSTRDLRELVQLREV